MSCYTKRFTSFTLEYEYEWFILLGLWTHSKGLPCNILQGKYKMHTRLKIFVCFPSLSTGFNILYALHGSLCCSIFENRLSERKIGQMRVADDRREGKENNYSIFEFIPRQHCYRFTNHFSTNTNSLPIFFLLIERPVDNFDISFTCLQ